MILTRSSRVVKIAVHNLSAGAPTKPSRGSSAKRATNSTRFSSFQSSVACSKSIPCLLALALLLAESYSNSRYNIYTTEGVKRDQSSPFAGDCQSPLLFTFPPFTRYRGFAVPGSKWHCTASPACLRRSSIESAFGEDGFSQSPRGETAFRSFLDHEDQLAHAGLIPETCAPPQTGFRPLFIPLQPHVPFHTSRLAAVSV